MGLSSKQVSGDSRLEWSTHPQGLLFNAGETLPEKPKSHGRQANLEKLQGGPPQSPPPTLKCPRCESSNTKFCYYNNYSRSQPRHFCKACRRHWTNGGTLRNVPVGGTRKTKRFKTSHQPSASTAAPTAMQQQEPFSFSDVIRQALLHHPPPPPPSSIPAVMPPDYLSTSIGGGGFLGSLKHIPSMPSFTIAMGSSNYVESTDDAFIPSYSSFLRLTRQEHPLSGEEDKAATMTIESSMPNAAGTPWLQSSLPTCSLAVGTSPVLEAPPPTAATCQAGGGGYWWDDLTRFISPPPPPQNSHLLL